MKRLLMRHQLLILATMAAILFAACAAERPEQEAGSNGMSGSWTPDPITFGVSDSTSTDTIAPPPMLTRAPQNEASLTTVQASGFGVFAARTGAHKYANSSISSNFMSNEKIYYQAPSWRYDLTKYWPNGEDGADEYISFFAYAPYSDGGGTNGVTDFSLPIELGDPWLVFKLPDDIASQIDLLYAAKVDQQKNTNNGKVEFTFKHALACVGDKITTGIKEELGTLLQTEFAGNASLTKIEVILHQITIDYTLTQKGKLTLGSKARWQPVMSEAPTVTRTVTLDRTASPVTLATITSADVSTHEVTDENNGVFYIPVQAGGDEQKATITLDYSIVRTFSDASTTTFNGNTTNTIGLQAAGGEVAGEHLSLNLNLSENIRVKPYDFTGFSILPINDVIYTGSALEPVVVVTNGNKTLVKDVDYTVSYTNNINVGIGTVTINGKGEYDEDVTLSANFNINRRDISGFTVTGINDLVYNGSEQTVTPVVKYGETTLEAGVDYTVSGTSQTNAGSYTVTITGKGNYTGTIARQWRIEKAAGSISYATTSIEKLYYETTPFTNTLTKTGDGTVNYTSNKTSVATVNSFTGEVTLTGTTGTATITATVTNGTNYNYATTTASYTITVLGPEYMPLTFEAKVANAVVSFETHPQNPVTFQYSKNGGTWTNYTSDITLSNIGDKVSFRGNNPSYGGNVFHCSADCYIYGNIMSLINSTNYANSKTLTGEATFGGLFIENTHIVNHQSKPLLLPATTLTANCYSNMFLGCTGLTTAPALPATTLANGCYRAMFWGCTGLTTAPVLPATTLTERCYIGMFTNCSKLNKLTCLATTISGSDCTTDWLKNVSTTGTFTKSSSVAVAWWGTGTSGIPPGWTVNSQ